jgi:hypothetical protein
LAMIFSANAKPMPEVAPTTRTVLYGKGMVGYIKHKKNVIDYELLVT